MEQRSGLKCYHEGIKEDTRIRIDKAIQTMRAEKVTITISSLAEEMGLSRRTMYADYVQSFLKNYREFNPLVSQEPDPEAVLELKNTISALNAKLKESSRKNRELKLENAVLKESLRESEERYAYLLGRYQEDVGNKIIQF